MIKVRILDRCEFCDGQAYVFVCEDVDMRGETFDRYRPCEICYGSGNQAKWVSLRELYDLLDRALFMEYIKFYWIQDKPMPYMGNKL
jgi:hypothetical protein